MIEQHDGPEATTKDGYGKYASGEEERQITDEAIAFAKTLVGSELVVRDMWNTEATRDSIRHFAHSLGQDNPLYSNPAYAAGTRWGGIIAPPNFHRALGVAAKTEWTPEERQRARDPLAGIHSWYSGTHIQFFLPIHVNDVLKLRAFQGDYIEKRSEFSGRTVLDYRCEEGRNQRNELVLRATRYTTRGGRQKAAGERKKYSEIAQQTYTPDDIKKIEADYDRMEVRGSEPRYWEDVNVGDELIPTVYGPLTITDMLASASGTGLVMSGSNAFKLAYEQRKKIPLAWLVNEHGIPDVIESVHWDYGIAKRTGNPMPYDYGDQRTAFMTHVITNWMGDDGWLRMIDNQIRRFVYIGDTEWAKGRVTGKRRDGQDAIVELEVWVEDQRGRITAPGRAEVLLPSKDLGPVQLPTRFGSPPPGWYSA